MGCWEIRHAFNDACIGYVYLKQVFYNSSPQVTMNLVTRAMMGTGESSEYNTVQCKWPDKGVSLD